MRSWVDLVEWGDSAWGQLQQQITPPDGSRCRCNRLLAESATIKKDEQPQENNGTGICCIGQKDDCVGIGR